MLTPLHGDKGFDAGTFNAWIFDLDNTLYCQATTRLFDQIEARMTAFVQQALNLDYDAARKLQKDYFVQHGTTLKGLTDHHGVAPADFLDYVHRIDLRCVPHNASLKDAFERYTGKIIVFTNGSEPHACNVLKHLDLFDRVDGIFDIVASDYNPKPARQPYEKMLNRFALDPKDCIMVEDIPRNLEPAAALGMTTLWVKTDTEYAAMESLHGTPLDAYVHHTTHDLAAWLQAYLTPTKSSRIQHGT